ncbi:MAG: alpha/beta hydrolase [Anaerolineales bacterium]|nr:alpha/beta hydrolase [Anaerolineales bacterium]
MSAIIIDGAMVHYEALGRGRPIVFLHGWVGSWRYWINAMQVASTSFRAYAIDLFGFGDTMRDPSRYSLERQADLVNRFLEEMGIGKVALVGHDLGALVAFSYIKQYPKSVDRMMAVNCPLEYDSVNARVRTSSMQDLVDWLSNRSPESASALADAAKSDPQAVSASLAGLQSADIFPSVRNLAVPCLFVYGPNDPAVSMPSQERTDSFPNHMHQINLEGAGHFPMIENPSQFNRLMTDFLSLDSGVTPRDLQLKEEWKRRVR